MAAEIESLRRQLAAKEEVVSTLESNITKLESNVTGLESNISKLESNISKLESNITSWNTTHLLRKKLFGKIRERLSLRSACPPTDIFGERQRQRDKRCWRVQQSRSRS